MKKIIIGLIVFFLPMVANALGENSMEVKYQKLFSIQTPEGYTGMQGMIVTNKYFIVAAIKEDHTNTMLLAYDKNNFNLVFTTLNEHIGHANDMAYLEKKNEIYIINEKYIYIFDANTLEEKSQIELPFVHTGIDIYEEKYLLRTEETMYIYDKDFKELGSFSIQENYSRQSIAYNDNYIYYSLYVPYDGAPIAKDTSLVRVYNLEGELIKTLYNSEGYGELEAMEFYNGIPYLFFFDNKGNSGIYTPIYQIVEQPIYLNLENALNSEIILTENDHIMDIAKVKNDEITFAPILYSEPGIHNYIIKKNDNSEESSKIADVQIFISYDTKNNELTSTMNVKKSINVLEPIENLPKSIKCEAIDGVYYDENGNETTKDMFEKNCGVVENPKTGASIPLIFFAIIISLILIIKKMKKNKFYKI